MAAAPKLDDCQLIWGTNLGEQITVQTYSVNKMDLGDKEWRDVLLLCYVIYPPYLTPHCDG